jgi:predicted metal-dependent hydrolase
MPSTLHVRTPDLAPGDSPVLWSKVPEFAISFNAFSAAIPYFEAHLNSTMLRVRALHGQRLPVLDEQLLLFVRQEANHARYHREFNERLFESGVQGLDLMLARLKDDLQRLGSTRSLEFNTAYCAGLETVATFAAMYLYERCDDLFAGADPHGANLLLWHFAEEFEHRSVCHDAFQAVSGRYIARMHGLQFAFRHASRVFRQIEKLLLIHYQKDLPARQRAKSDRRALTLYLRQTGYLLPRMLKITMPGYHPGSVREPERIRVALAALRETGPIRRRVAPQAEGAQE